MTEDLERRDPRRLPESRAELIHRLFEESDKAVADFFEAYDAPREG